MKFKCEAETICLKAQHFLLLFIFRYYYLLQKKEIFLHFKLLFLINLVYKLVESAIKEAAVTLKRLFQGISRPLKPQMACFGLYI